MSYYKNFWLTCLEELEQEFTIDTYYRSFDALRGLIEYTDTDIPEEYYTGLFVKGLKIEVHAYVEGFLPITVLDAYCLAAIFDNGYSRTFKPEQAQRKSIICDDVVSIESDIDAAPGIPSVIVADPSTIDDNVLDEPIIHFGDTNSIDEFEMAMSLRTSSEAEGEYLGKFDAQQTKFDAVDIDTKGTWETKQKEVVLGNVVVPLPVKCAQCVCQFLRHKSTLNEKLEDTTNGQSAKTVLTSVGAIVNPVSHELLILPVIYKEYVVDDASTITPIAISDNILACDVFHLASTNFSFDRHVVVVVNLAEVPKELILVNKTATSLGITDDAQNNIRGKGGTNFRAAAVDTRVVWDIPCASVIARVTNVAIYEWSACAHLGSFVEWSFVHRRELVAFAMLKTSSGSVTIKECIRCFDPGICYIQCSYVVAAELVFSLSGTLSSMPAPSEALEWGDDSHIRDKGGTLSCLPTHVMENMSCPRLYSSRFHNITAALPQFDKLQNLFTMVLQSGIKHKGSQVCRIDDAVYTVLNDFSVVLRRWFSIIATLLLHTWLLVDGVVGTTQWTLISVAKFSCGHCIRTSIEALTVVFAFSSVQLDGFLHEDTTFFPHLPAGSSRQHTLIEYQNISIEEPTQFFKFSIWSVGTFYAFSAIHEGSSRLQHDSLQQSTCYTFIPNQFRFYVLAKPAYQCSLVPKAYILCYAQGGVGKSHGVSIGKSGLLISGSGLLLLGLWWHLFGSWVGRYLPWHCIVGRLCSLSFLGDMVYLSYVGCSISFCKLLALSELLAVLGEHYVYYRRWVLAFPIIQCSTFFSFKMELPSAIRTTLKLSSLSFLCLCWIQCVVTITCLVFCKRVWVIFLVIFQAGYRCCLLRRPSHLLVAVQGVFMPRMEVLQGVFRFYTWVMSVTVQWTVPMLTVLLANELPCDLLRIPIWFHSIAVTTSHSGYSILASVSYVTCLDSKLGLLLWLLAERKHVFGGSSTASLPADPTVLFLIVFMLMNLFKSIASSSLFPRYLGIWMPCGQSYRLQFVQWKRSIYAVAHLKWLFQLVYLMILSALQCNNWIFDHFELRDRSVHELVASVHIFSSIILWVTCSILVSIDDFLVPRLDIMRFFFCWQASSTYDNGKLVKIRGRVQGTILCSLDVSVHTSLNGISAMFVWQSRAKYGMLDRTDLQSSKSWTQFFFPYILHGETWGKIGALAAKFHAILLLLALYGLILLLRLYPILIRFLLRCVATTQLGLHYSSNCPSAAIAIGILVHSPKSIGGSHIWLSKCLQSQLQSFF